MSVTGRRQRLVFGLVGAAFLGAVAAVAAPPPSFHEGPKPFAATASELLDLDRKARAWVDGAGGKGHADVVVLWRHYRHSFDDAGLPSASLHEIFSVRSPESARVMAQVSAPWQSTYHQAPSLRARVIAPGGQVHTLDSSKLVVEKGAPSSGPLVFTDHQRLRGPLPGMTAGAIVEVLTELKGHTAAFAGGSSINQVLVPWLASYSTRVEIEGPSDGRLHYAAHQLQQAKAVVRQAGGRAIVRWDLGPLRAEPIRASDGMPPDVRAVPQILASAARSWEDLGRRYSERLAQVAARADLSALARELGGGTRDQRIRRALRWMKHNIRYTALALGEAGVIPAPPTEVLSRRFGDCKDQSLLLVTILRAMGIEAQPALLAATPRPDVDETVPGLEQFTHMIVMVPGPKPLFLDATSEFLFDPGEIPFSLGGRRALVLGPKPAFAMIPLPRASENAIDIDWRMEMRENDTLACLLAEQGQLDESIKLIRGLRDGGLPAPALALALGIIAEKLGLPDAAGAYYKVAESAPRSLGVIEKVTDYSALARSRLERLATAAAGPR